MKTTLGGVRLGAGGKMVNHVRGFGMSTHDLGKTVRTSGTTGTLMPIFCEITKEGDVWEMDLNTLVRSHPTIGPVFGTYKVQVDVFTADVRLYHKLLHNNTVRLGMTMEDVKLPQTRILTQNPCYEYGDLNQQQIAPDSLLNYAGIKGIGTMEELWDGSEQGRDYVVTNFFGMWHLMYWDIYKEYYSNKQEEIGYVITPEFETGKAVVDYFNVLNENGVIVERVENEVTEQKRVDVLKGYSIEAYGNFLGNRILTVLKPSGSNTILEDLGDWESVIVDEKGLKIQFNNFGSESTYISSGAATTNQPRQIIKNRIDSNPEWGGSGEKTVTKGIRLEEFPLKNIDDVRMKIFAKDAGTPLLIGFNEKGQYAHDVYEMPYYATTGISNRDPETGQATRQSENYSKYTMSGLGVKTYQSDRFNNWLNKTWVDNINSKSSVAINEGSFTMDALAMANKIWRLENDIQMLGGTYHDWLSAISGRKSTGATEMPVYRGGLSAMMVFDEVVSSSSTTGGDGRIQPLGTLGGRGSQRSEKGGKIRVQIDEPGMIMVIVSLTPHIDYYQGNKWWTRLKTMDDWHKPQLDAIGYQNLLTEEMAAFDTKISTNHESRTTFSAGKQTSWVQYQTNQNEVHGNFARANNEEYMVLTRRYEADENGRISDLTTYIDPTKFNYPFAYQELDSQPFWIQVSIDANVRRIMAANQMPNINM